MFESRQERRENFLELTFCAVSFLLPQLHIKDSGHSAKCAGYSYTRMHPTYVALNEVM